MRRFGKIFHKKVKEQNVVERGYGAGRGGSNLCWNYCWNDWEGERRRRGKLKVKERPNDRSERLVLWLWAVIHITQGVPFLSLVALAGVGRAGVAWWLQWWWVVFWCWNVTVWVSVMVASVFGVIYGCASGCRWQVSWGKTGREL